MFPINQVLQGDCTRVLRTLPNEVVDLVMTDPPYGVRCQDGFGRTIANDDDPSRVLGAFTELYRVLRPNSVCIGGGETIKDVRTYGGTVSVERHLLHRVESGPGRTGSGSVRHCDLCVEAAARSSTGSAPCDAAHSRITNGIYGV